MLKLILDKRMLIKRNLNNSFHKYFLRNAIFLRRVTIVSAKCQKSHLLFCGDRSISGQGFLMRESIHNIEKYEIAYSLKIMDLSIKYFPNLKIQKYT